MDKTSLINNLIEYLKFFHKSKYVNAPEGEKLEDFPIRFIKSQGFYDCILQIEEIYKLNKPE